MKRTGQNEQSCKVSVHYVLYSRKWEHFQITKFNRVYMAGGQALPSSNFFHTILLIFLRLELSPPFIFQCYRPQTWQFYLHVSFPALSISSIHKVSSIKFKGASYCRLHDPFFKRPILPSCPKQIIWIVLGEFLVSPTPNMRSPANFSILYHT